MVKLSFFFLKRPDIYMYTPHVMHIMYSVQLQSLEDDFMKDMAIMLHQPFHPYMYIHVMYTL